MVAISSSVKLLYHQSNSDSVLLSSIIFSSFGFDGGGVANKLGAVVDSI